MQNRCAHRSYPLHLGELNGDRIVCGYHGFEYGPDGRCAYVPAQDAARPGIRIQPYPIVEVGPFIWIWPGDPDALDPALVTPQPWFTEPGWRYVHGYFEMQANYMPLHENLMDLTHFAFLHSFGRGNVGLARQRARIDDRPDGVWSTLEMPNFPVSPAARAEGGFEGPVTEYTEAVTGTPAMHYARAMWSDAADPPHRITRYIVHCLTPESLTKTHYFWAVSRDGGIDNAEMDAEIAGVAANAFEEDCRAIEAVEALLQRDHRPGFREMIVPSDAGAVLLLRRFARMAQGEAEARACR